MAARNTRWTSPEDLAKDLSGKTLIVTGANSGVGLETTRQLIKQGAHVVMACRRVDAAEAEAESFTALSGSYEIIECDLASLSSVRNFVAHFLGNHTLLHGLVCNAGFVSMGNQAQYTVDGLEETIAVSYFGHFLLTELLLETLKASAPSRVGILSSVVHAGGPKSRPQLDLDDLNYRNRKFSGFRVYAEAKVATNLYAMELAERLSGTGVVTASIHPGWARSNFGGNGVMMQVVRFLLSPFMGYLSDSNEASAQTSLHFLLNDDAASHSGAYFSQRSVLYRDKGTQDGGWPMVSPNPHARDMSVAKALVAKSRDLVGL